ncbi:MAG: FAD/NAD(P)-binding oxidoreductase [Bacteroidota bacterium]
MSEKLFESETSRCIIVGASHGGISVAFALRQFGWKGSIDVFDALPCFPHQKPPLSKDFLNGRLEESMLRLRAEKAYEKARVNLHLGQRVIRINRAEKTIDTKKGKWEYDSLILATGAEALIPPIKGIALATNIFTIRHLPDSEKLKACIDDFEDKGKIPKAVIIGAGYIGLEAAASLRKMGVTVTILERESRVLQRVTAPILSEYFTKLHEANGVNVITSKKVSAIETSDGQQFVVCEDGTKHEADIVIVGVGIKVNKTLAEDARLQVDDGICVNGQCQTSDQNIYALGDCVQHHSSVYQRTIRLESVQNAMDQANVVAMHLTGKEVIYDKVPWFWSDQYGLKLQIVGLLHGHTDIVVRKNKDDEKSISVWYFDGNRLLAVDAINQPKSYSIGMRVLSQNLKIDKSALASIEELLKPENIVLTPNDAL